MNTETAKVPKAPWDRPAKVSATVREKKVLRLLAGNAASDQGLTASVIGRTLAPEMQSAAAASSVHPILTTLESAGLISRHVRNRPKPILWSLTESGKQAVAVAKDGA